MPLIPCKHIDHSEETYGWTCKLITLETGVKYWERQNLPYPEAPRDVQFCGLGRGRINNIYDCYRAGNRMSCYVAKGGTLDV